MKRTIELGTNWFDDPLPYPLPVCVITSRDRDDRVNAGAYSLVIPWSGSKDKPQVVVIAHQNTRTANNIRATGEFVLNYVPQEYLKDVVAVGWPRPAEVDKVALTRFSLAPAAQVRVPYIQEAVFCLECVLDQILCPTPAQSNFVGNVVHAAMEARLLEMGKKDRLRKAGLAVFLGYEEGQYFFCPLGRPIILAARPEALEKRPSPLAWEPGAEELLKQVPALFRTEARKTIEKWLREEGKQVITEEDVRRIQRDMGFG